MPLSDGIHALFPEKSCRYDVLCMRRDTFDGIRSDQQHLLKYMRYNGSLCNTESPEHGCNYHLINVLNEYPFSSDIEEAVPL